MAKYVFKRYYRCSNGEIDDENVWVRADSESEARREVMSDYHSTTDLVLLRVDKE